MRDWVYPRWREVGVTLITSAALAARPTGAYPMIIKQSFDSPAAGQARRPAVGAGGKWW